MSEQLYKFRTWSNSNHQTILSGPEIKFTTPLEFNDPFDCFITWQYLLMTEENQISRLVALRRNADPRLDESKLYRLARQKRNEHPLFNPNTFEKASDEWIEKCMSSIGIFSLCEAVDDILLWSHYSAGHTGFAVEFSKSILREYLIQTFMPTKKSVSGERVSYVTDYPILIPSPDLNELDEQKLLNKTMLTKSKCWWYEKEYRYILFGGPNLVIPIPPDCITGIYLGLRISEADKNEILEIRKRVLPRATVYLTRKESGKFGLEFLKLN